MKIKIIADGTPYGKKVVNAETGETIEGVTRVVWQANADGLPTAFIEFINVPVELSIDSDDILVRTRVFETTTFGDIDRKYRIL